MSKTKEQVNRYLTHCRFPADDWNKILLYCRQNNLGYAHKSAHPKSDSTFDQFIEWIKNGFGSGDVVRYGHTIGILSTCTPEYSLLCAYYSYDNKLLVSDLQISTDRIIEATDTDKKRIYGELRMSGLDFDERLARICEKKLPPVLTRIAYRHNDILGYGIIRCYKNNVAHFVFGIENGEVKRDFEIPIFEFSSNAIDKDGIAIITNTLNDSLLRWNTSTCQLEHLHPRARFGETYWYITDKFSVSNAIENNAPTSNVRYERGNYFLNHAEATEFLMTIQQLRKKKGDE